MSETPVTPNVNSEVQRPLEAPAQSQEAPQKPKVESAEPKKSVDLLIVLGQGPVKSLLRPEELDPNRQKEWESFKKDPLHSVEPDFRVVEGPFARALVGLDESQIEAKMIEWQQMGRFGLNRWGRENALAAGFALVSGYTDRLLLSGGKTKPDWAAEKLSPARLESWPSEAQLMADVIRRRFGEAYQEQYGRPIDSVIVLEDKSTNTLTNFAHSMDSMDGKAILDGMIKAGVLGTNFHVPRGEDIAMLFAPGVELQKGTSAQDILEKRVIGSEVEEEYRKILGWMSDPENSDLRAREAWEKVWSHFLSDPELLTYWLGYLGMVEDPRVLQNTVQKLNSDPDRRNQAILAFNQAGLDFDQLSSSDLTSLPAEDFKQIAEKLTILSTPEYRAMPEPV